MDRITRRFQELRAAKRAALIPFLTTGYPSREGFVELLLEVEAAGADLLELGVPFSDPLADGPIIQAASQRALSQGVVLETTLEAVASLRGHSEIPVVLFSYLNPLLQRDPETVAEDLAEAGVDGLLVVDLPFEETAEWREVTLAKGIALIALLAPTTSTERLARIAERAQGFLYYISTTGVTGPRDRLRTDLHSRVRAIRSVSTLPVAVGFGISSPEQAEVVAGLADGVVVGSALVERLGRDRREGLRFLESVAGRLRWDGEERS